MNNSSYTVQVHKSGCKSELLNSDLHWQLGNCKANILYLSHNKFKSIHEKFLCCSTWTCIYYLRPRGSAGVPS